MSDYDRGYSDYKTGRAADRFGTDLYQAGYAAAKRDYTPR